MEEYITVVLTKKEVSMLIQAIDDMDFYDEWLFEEELEDLMKIQAKLLMAAETERKLIPCPECGRATYEDDTWKSRRHCPKHGYFDLSG